MEEEKKYKYIIHFDNNETLTIPKKFMDIIHTGQQTSDNEAKIYVFTDDDGLFYEVYNSKITFIERITL